MASNRRRVTAVIKYAEAKFNEADWYTLGEISGGGSIIADHGRLLRSYSFGDPDYPSNVAEVIFGIFKEYEGTLDDVIDHFDIDIWYKSEYPDKYKKAFGGLLHSTADFWKDGYLKMFISHLSKNKITMSQLKEHLDSWGISAFVAHEDIEVSREWQTEIESGLATMDVLIAVIEGGFKDSNWCAQEVGIALGRGVDVIPLRAGADPFGFISKYQGLQVKGKLPRDVAEELACVLIKKGEYRPMIVNGLLRSLPSLDSSLKIERFKRLDSSSSLLDSELRTLLEGASLSQFEKNSLDRLIKSTGAFATDDVDLFADDDIPF